MRIDGHEIDPMDITIGLKGKDYGLAALPRLGNVFWPVAEPVTVKVYKQGGFDAGGHDIEFIMYFRSPYIEIGPNKFMPNDGCGFKRLTFEGGAGA